MTSEDIARAQALTTGHLDPAGLARHHGARPWELCAATSTAELRGGRQAADGATHDRDPMRAFGEGPDLPDVRQERALRLGL
jgi:hypothetical protein